MTYKAYLSNSAVFLMLVLSFLLFSNQALAKINYPLTNDIPFTGYIWSGYGSGDAGIGWISMNCSNASSCADNGGVDYGVELKQNGDVEGYAWSSNVGWVQFGGLNEGDMPGNQGNASLTDEGSLMGWARIVSGADANDGWDGWILLNSSTWGVKFDVDTGQTIGTPSDVYSWAWGGDKIAGWLDFSQVALNEAPNQSTDVDLVVSNLNYNSSGSEDLVNGRFSTMSFPMTLQNIGAGSTPEGENIPWKVTINDNRTGSVDYTQQSTTSGPIAGNGASITAQASETDFLYGVYETQAEVNHNQSVGEDDYSNNIANRTFTIRPPDPQMTLSAERNILRSGSIATISWDTVATYPMDCEITGPGVDIAFDPSVDGSTGSVDTSERYNAAVYNLTCNEPITDTTFTSDQLTIEVVPYIREI